jgi:hypothetical protein
MERFRELISDGKWHHKESLARKLNHSTPRVLRRIRIYVTEQKPHESQDGRMLQETSRAIV